MNLGVVGMMGVLPTHTISGFFVMIVLPQRYFRRFLALFSRALGGLPRFKKSWFEELADSEARRK
jgi:hypothetical protein